MNKKLSNYLNLLQLSYDDAVGFLLKKYGPVKNNYFKEKSYKRLNEGSHKFYQLGISDKIIVIKNLLIACHANASAGYMKQINVNNTNINTIVTLTDSAKLIYQSPTGMHEVKRKISDLF